MGRCVSVEGVTHATHPLVFLRGWCGCFLKKNRWRHGRGRGRPHVRTCKPSGECTYRFVTIMNWWMLAGQDRLFHNVQVAKLMRQSTTTLFLIVLQDSALRGIVWHLVWRSGLFHETDSTDVRVMNEVM